MADQPTGATRGSSRRLLLVVRSMIMALVVIGLAWAIYRASLQLAENPLEWERVAWWRVCLAIPFGAAALIVNGTIWRASLLQMEQSVSWPASQRAYLVSQLGKYVPGKAMVVILRVAIVARQGVAMSPAIASCFVETLFWLLVGSELACLVLLVFYPSQFWLQAIALVCVLGGTALAAPPILTRLMTLVNNRLNRAADGGSTIRISWSFYLQSHLGFSIAWLLQALGTWSVISAMPDVEFRWSDGALALATITTSTVIGFLSMLPGGLGARELAVIPLLVPRLTLPQALTVAVFMRLASVITEVLLAAIMTRWPNKRPKEQQTQEGEQRE